MCAWTEARCKLRPGVRERSAHGSKLCGAPPNLECPGTGTISRWSRTLGNGTRVTISSAGLASLELRFALVHEGGDSLLEVVGGAQHPVCQAFELEPEAERAFVGVVEHALSD